MKNWLGPSFRLLLVFMLVGGGYAGVIFSALPLPHLSGTELKLCVLTLILHLFVLVSGMIYVQNPRRLTAVMIALAIQIPACTLGSLSYRLCDGMYCIVGIDETGPYLNAAIGVIGAFKVGAGQGWKFAINIVPLILVIATAIVDGKQSRASSPAS